MASSQLGLVHVVVDVIKEDKSEARITALATCLNLSLASENRLTMGSSQLGLVQVLVNVIKEDKADARKYALRTCQNLCIAIKNIVIMGSSQLGLLQLVFVMMDIEYTTVSENRVDGWLGFMLGDALWYPLWDDSHVHSTGNEIVKIIGDKGKIGMPAVLQTSPTPAQTAVSSPALSASVSQEKGGGKSREENGRLSKELSMASAYILLTDERKAKPTEVAVLKQSLDDEGIDDPSVLR